MREFFPVIFSSTALFWLNCVFNLSAGFSHSILFVIEKWIFSPEFTHPHRIIFIHNLFKYSIASISVKYSLPRGVISSSVHSSIFKSPTSNPDGMLVVLLFHQLSLNCSIESLFANENIRVEAEIHNPSDLKKNPRHKFRLLRKFL